MQKQSKISLWMRTALSIVSSGAPIESARHLGISITTVYRHLDALEKELEFKIFDRSHSGWELRDEAAVLLKTSTEIELLLLHAESQMRQLAGTESGILRIAVSDDFASYITHHLKDFCQIYPKIQPELIISSQFSHLNTGDVDVAIRPDMDPGDNLIGQRIGVMKHALYASKEYIDKRGLPISSQNLNNHSVCGYGSKLQHYSAAKWEKQNIDPESTIARFGTTTAITQAVAKGLGMGILPCFVGKHQSDITPVIKIKDGLPIDIWVVTTSTFRHRPKVQAFFDFFVPLLKADKASFRGD